VKARGRPPELRDLVGIPDRRSVDATAVVDISGVALDGRACRVPVRDTGQWSLLLFLSADCLGCEVFWEAVRDPVGRGLSQREAVIVVIRARQDPSLIGRLAEGASVPVVVTDAAWSVYRVQGPPFFVLVDGVANLVVAEGVAWAVDQLAGHVRHARGTRIVPGEPPRDVAEAEDRDPPGYGSSGPTGAECGA
jgi:hypothetical protein